MKQSSPDPTLGSLRVFVACLLSFTILITPFAALARPTNQRSEIRGQGSAKTRGSAPNNKESKSSAADPFVNPLNESAPETSAALPGPRPEPAPQPLAPPPVGTVTATMIASIANDDGDSKIDPTNGNPGSTERIDYTVTLSNNSGSPATGLKFDDTLDPHTTLVPGSVNGTPIAFDQSITINEDATNVAITLTGEDPDGSNVTFVNVPANTTQGGTLTGTAPNLTYNPAANFFGTDTFTFKVNDGTANSNEVGTVTITVNSVNDAPTFTVPGNPAAVNEDSGAHSVPFITPASVRPAQSGNTTEDGQTVSFVITNDTNPGLFSSGPTINVDASASYPKTATLTYTSAANQNGTATITYHAHDNGGTANGGVDNSADQTFTITVNAVNDPPVVVAPSAFSAQANMKITGLTGLLGNVNDNADNGVNGCVSTTFTVNAGSISGTTAHGGTVTLTNATTGTFDYDPPAGYTGADTFTYTVNDTGCPGPGVASTPATTVTINVAGPVIWFVNTTLGPTGNGTLLAPFNNLDAVTNSGTGKMGINANQRVFVFSGSNTAVGTTTTLQGNNTAANQAATQVQAQWMIGQGTVASSFDSFFGITPPAGTIARPTLSSNTTTANGMRPTIQGTVTMKENTVVQGLNIVVTGGSKGITTSSLAAGTSGSDLVIKDVSVTSATGNAVDISGTANANNTVQYTTSDNTNSPNVLVSVGGRALSVVNVAIDSVGLNFKSISANGGSKGIVLNNTGTAAGNGGLTVTGTGTTVGSGGTIQNISARGAEFVQVKSVTLKNMNFTNANTADAGGAGVCDGTVVTGCNAAIYLNGLSTAPTVTTFDNLDLTGTMVEAGIAGTNVSTLTFTNGTIANAGTNQGGSDLPADEGAMLLRESTGTMTIDNDDFSFAGGRTVQIRNTAGSLTYNTTSSTYRDTQSSANGQNGLQIVTTGSGAVHPRAPWSMLCPAASFV